MPQQYDEKNLPRNLLRGSSIDLATSLTGRQEEVYWLAHHVMRHRQLAPIVVCGVGGIGKTTLLRVFFSQVAGVAPAWLTLDRASDAMNEASAFVEALRLDRNGPVHVVIDGADWLSDAQMVELGHRVFNNKRIRSLIFATRRGAHLPRGETLRMAPLGKAAIIEMMLKRGAALSESELARAVEAVGGIPLAVEILTGLAERHPDLSIRDLFQGRIYELEKSIPQQPAKLITEIRPKLVIAKETLLEELKRQPESLFKLPPRKFEEVIADLLDGMGYEVQLTPATRDGGKDILAYIETPAAKLLCLVEVKRLRRDRTVGVGLVRTLYGTLCDHQANSAMLVTTSCFSDDAHAFQQRHEFQLALHDYGNVVSWIQDHKLC